VQLAQPQAPEAPCCCQALNPGPGDAPAAHQGEVLQAAGVVLHELGEGAVTEAVGHIVEPGGVGGRGQRGGGVGSMGSDNFL